MDKGICTVSIAAIRAENSHQSEMTSQILYGETIEILAIEGDFAYIRMHFDHYEGWLSVYQFSRITEENFSSRTKHILSKNFEVYDLPEGKKTLSIGSEIDLQSENTFKNPSSENITETAKLFLNVPYLWSGRSFFGIDCSGFVQLIYKVHGISLPREAHQQAEVGQVLSFAEESNPGDLAFFENEEGKISHVGMLLNPTEIIHAFGEVRIDSLDSTGIFNKDLRKHTHRLRFIKTYF